MTGTGERFDINAFNKAFDHQKKSSPSCVAVQPYGEIPTGLFSNSKGLVEDTNVSGVKLNHGTQFDNKQDLDSLVGGTSFNPDKNKFNINKFRCSDYVSGSNNHEDKNYSRIRSAPDSLLQRRVQEMQDDRERLMDLNEKDFVVEQSEIEKQYNELFELNENAVLQGLETKKRHRRKKQPQTN